MDTAELKALPRHVAHMRYEQVRALFDENRKLLNAHAEATQRGDYCPECHWHTERVYARCPEQEAIWRAHRSVLEAAPIVKRHVKTCQECQTVLREWQYLDSCEAISRLRAIEQVCSRRLHYLTAKQRKAEGS